MRVSVSILKGGCGKGTIFAAFKVCRVDRALHTRAEDFWGPALTFARCKGGRLGSMTYKPTPPLELFRVCGLLYVPQPKLQKNEHLAAEASNL